MKGKNLQPRILYLNKHLNSFDGEINSVSYKQKLRELSTNKPVLQQILKVKKKRPQLEKRKL